MANQNRQWALPSKPGGRRKGSKPKPQNKNNASVSSNQNSSASRSGADSPSFGAARAMFEAKSRNNTASPAPPKRRTSTKNMKKYTQKTDNPSSSSSAKPPPSMTGNEYTPNTSHTSNTWPQNKDTTNPTVPDIPPMDDNRPEPLTTIIEDNANTHVSPPPSMTGNAYTNPRGNIPPNAEQKTPTNQRYVPPNVVTSPQHGYNANPNANRGNNQGYSPIQVAQKVNSPVHHYSNTQPVHFNQNMNQHNRVGSGNFNPNQRGFNNQNRSNPNASPKYPNPPPRGGYQQPQNVNNRYNNQYNNTSPNRYNNSGSFSPHSAKSPLHNRGGSGNFNPNQQHNRANSSSFNQNKMNHQQQHNRVASAGFSPRNTQPIVNRTGNPPQNMNQQGPNRNPHHRINNGYPSNSKGHARNNTNNMGHNIEWNYGGTKPPRQQSPPPAQQQQKEESPPAPARNPNAMPYGMKDTRSSYVQQQAAHTSLHRKKPTFGASSQLDDLRRAQSADVDDDEDEEEEEENVNVMSPQFPKMENSPYANPGGASPRMDKDYDPFSDIKNEAAEGGANEAEAVPFDIPPMEEAAAAAPPAHAPQEEEEDNDNGVPIGNLSTFLDDTTLLRTFLKFLKKKTDDYKLLEFYLMAGQFRTYAQDPKSTRAAQRNNAKLIIETFFLPDSKKFLEKIQGMTRHEAMSQFLTAGKNTDLEPTLFDSSRQEVKSELISRVFPIFMQSDRYKKLVNEGKVRPP
eukprot:809037_1